MKLNFKASHHKAPITLFYYIIYLQSQMRKQKRQDTNLQNANKRNRKDV